MEYRISDLELEIIYRRIKENELDLQPNFQRGEVWSEKKKKKLIDTILRNWQVPPIHMLEKKNSTEEILDGQQRLATIRDFFDNKIQIDGFIEPHSSEIKKYHDFYFEQLPDSLKRDLRRYTIRAIRIYKYDPKEASELFFRLNQPSTLTSAEQRNSFIGITRDQVKDVVNYFEKICENEGFSPAELIGFSNSRMAYDDIFSKILYTLEIKTLNKKISSNDIAEKYRENIPFSIQSVENLKEVLLKFIEAGCKYNFGNGRLKYNKATFYSWLIYIYKNNYKLDITTLGNIIYEFELARNTIKSRLTAETNNFKLFNRYKHDVLQTLLFIFNQKSSMGSTDISSIIIRDIIINIFVGYMFSINIELVKDFEYLLEMNNKDVMMSLNSIRIHYNWGKM
ncbi:DUF262 domain-containing protein [Cetobacterium somerae]|uniref:DUF262 domain-containing protein n=1 Tax=Cetobacterium somerae TaxID=188913 RepID=UPI002E7B1704|nr:DUF262 domain-containing protein [Cetobacterium somerae]WVJ02111.1 DUF262 domain-containing protein [Cetobacterium somerae]